MTVPHPLQIRGEPARTRGGDQQVPPVLEIERFEIPALLPLRVVRKQLVRRLFGDLRLPELDRDPAEQGGVVRCVPLFQLFPGTGAGGGESSRYLLVGIEVPQFLPAVYFQKDLGPQFVVGPAAEDENRVLRPGDGKPALLCRDFPVGGDPELTFEAYKDFNLAFRPAAEGYARQYIRRTVPENWSEEPGACGWTIGTGSYAYEISGPGGHSGPGTGGLTSKLFWEAFAFTGSEKVLRETAYPALLSMAKHLLRVVREYDGLYLSVFSASPEQIICNNWTNPVQYYHTVGCAFDQQMIRENGLDLLRCVDRIGEENLPAEDLPVIRELRKQIERYDPVQVGWSGQIKEYREEKFYGEVGEYRHRHISQLVGLYPGTQITRETPAWLDAAKVTLNFRSDESTGWALAHRLNAWARTGDGNRAYKLYGNLLGMRTLPNLWDTHPPFQIDGNFGGCSGVAEMLLQSHETYIAPLACIPDAWDNGSFAGLCAREGFEIGAVWQNGCAKTLTVRSLAGNVCRIRYPGIAGAKIPFPHTSAGPDRIEFETAAGESYEITEIPAWEKKPVPASLRADRDGNLMWDFEGPVAVWRAADSSPVYEKIAEGIEGGRWTDENSPFAGAETVTYKITRSDAEDGSAPGALVTLNHSTALERLRYRYLVTQLNAVCGGVRLPETED